MMLYPQMASTTRPPSTSAMVPVAWQFRMLPLLRAPTARVIV
jgi:hypothetical protein